jgi:hypothetical protein
MPSKVAKVKRNTRTEAPLVVVNQIEPESKPKPRKVLNSYEELPIKSKQMTFEQMLKKELGEKQSEDPIEESKVEVHKESPKKPFLKKNVSKNRYVKGGNKH